MTVATDFLRLLVVLVTIFVGIGSQPPTKDWEAKTRGDTLRGSARANALWPSAFRSKHGVGPLAGQSFDLIVTFTSVCHGPMTCVLGPMGSNDLAQPSNSLVEFEVEARGSVDVRIPIRVAPDANDTAEVSFLVTTDYCGGDLFQVSWACEGDSVRFYRGSVRYLGVEQHRKRIRDSIRIADSIHRAWLRDSILSDSSR